MLNPNLLALLFAILLCIGLPVIILVMIDNYRPRNFKKLAQQYGLKYYVTPFFKRVPWGDALDLGEYKDNVDFKCSISGLIRGHKIHIEYARQNRSSWGTTVVRLDDELVICNISIKKLKNLMANIDKKFAMNMELNKFIQTL
jgi:hypothetical protein